ncbi:MAG: transglycosylase domain-containing protein, partial [Myxococcales bacterium]|nr:transglycosylase domain-containing protein [Myxococcales bacterium]
MPQPPPPRRGPSKAVKITLITLSVLFVLGLLGSVAAVVGVFWYYGRDLDALDEEGLRNYRPAQITRILARDGRLIGEVFTERRTFIEYEDIPSHVENAFLAAEDADFYRHEGMDYMGMVRALITNVKAGKIKQGASTITQQVVKIFMLSPERSFERKVQELILARRLEQALTKQEILELYLNEIYLGHGRYGIEEA